MKPIAAMKLLMPGAFLLVLGLGNLGVGHYKSLEYDQVLAELEPNSHQQMLQNISPMQRMQIERKAATRLDERRRKAEARRDFYHLVSFGGEGFLVLSLLLFLCGFAAWQYQRKRLAAPKISPESTGP